MARKAKRSKATPEDADLILKLYDLRRETVMRQARDFVITQFWPENYGEFKAVSFAVGTEHSAWLRQVLTFWDMAAALVLSGAVNENLFFQCNAEPYFLYAKFKAFIEPMRKDMSVPDFMAHLEELASKTAEARERVKRLQARFQARAAQLTAAKSSAAD